MAIAEVFPETMRGLATGVLMTGGGAGLFLMPPFLDWVIDGYGWRGAYVILGGLSLNWIAAAATIFRVGKDHNFAFLKYEILPLQVDLDLGKNSVQKNIFQFSVIKNLSKGNPTWKLFQTLK